MYKKTINYVDLNGKEHVEDHYFNLNKAELIKLQMSVKGGFDAELQRILREDDQPAFVDMFEDLIRRSYGIKTLDGSGFIKPKDAYDAFVASEAYSELFVELFTNKEAVVEFFNMIVPAAIINQIAANNAEN